MIRDNHECKSCKRNGKVTATGKLDVHHLREVRTHPQLALDINNLEVICVKCHNAEHDRFKDRQESESKFYVEERW